MGTSDETLQQERARRLKAARQHAGLGTAVDAALHLKVNKTTYSHHENGRRALSPESAEDYATKFGISTEWLLYGRDPPDWATPEPGADDQVVETEAPHFVQAWRLFRQLTVADLAGRLELPVELIESWEAGTGTISDKRLRKIAKVFETTPGTILDVDPRSIDPELLALWRDAATVQRETKKRLATITRTGTDG